MTSPYVGGGFGGKCLWDHQILGAAAAKLARRTVRIALSREGVYRVVVGRTLTEQRVFVYDDVMLDDDDTGSDEILAALVAVSLAGFITFVLWAIFG